MKGKLGVLKTYVILGKYVLSFKSIWKLCAKESHLEALEVASAQLQKRMQKEDFTVYSTEYFKVKSSLIHIVSI